MKRERGNIFVIAVLVLVSVTSVALAGYLFLENRKLKVRPATENTSPVTKTATPEGFSPPTEESQKPTPEERQPVSEAGTYVNKEFHFRIRYPTTWTAVEQGTTIYPPQGNVTISSPEAADGVIAIIWGGGFGGGPCQGQHQLVETKAGSIDMCRIVNADGSENLTRANDAKGETYKDPNNRALMFSVSLKKSASEEKALEILKTFEIYYLPD